MPLMYAITMQLDTEDMDDSSTVTMTALDATMYSQPVTALQTYEARPAELSSLSPFIMTMLFWKRPKSATSAACVTAIQGMYLHVYMILHAINHKVCTYMSI